MAYITITNGKSDLGWLELTGVVTVGRQTECDVSLPDDLMSRLHCRFQRDQDTGTWCVLDMGSKNGTWRAGHPIDRLDLQPGMQVRAGRTTLTYHAGDPPRSGRFCKRRVIRPADPHEALAATVMGMRVVEGEEEAAPISRPRRPVDPWGAMTPVNSRPRPTPRVDEPDLEEAAVGLLEMPEPADGFQLDLRRELEPEHDLLRSRALRNRPLPKPIMLEIPQSPAPVERLVPKAPHILIRISDVEAPEQTAAPAPAPREEAAPPVPEFARRKPIDWRRVRRLAFNAGTVLLWAASAATFGYLAFQ